MKKIQKTLFISIFLFAAGILASAETYTWTGAVDGVFTNPNNWKDSSNNTPTWGSILPAATYKISNTPSRIPYLPNNVTLAAGTTKIEVGTNSTSASLILGDFSFGGSVTIMVNEKGTLGLSGTPAQITLFNNSQITLQPDSTVWYYGGYPNNIFPGPYQNFKVTGNINADSLTVEKTTSIGNNNPVTIKAATQTYKGAVTVQKDVTFDAATSVTFTAAANVNAGTQNLSFTGGGAVNMQGVTAGTVDATGALSLTVNGTVNLSGDLKAKNLTVNTATVSAAKIEVNQAATVSTATTITAQTQTYTDAVTVNANTTFNASSNLTFGSDGTVGGTGSIIVSGNGTVNIQKNINLTGGTSKFEQTGTGAVNIGNVSSIKAATQIYKGAVTINADTEFNTSTALTFKDTVSGSQKITLSGTGNVNIGNNITLTGTNGIIEQTGSGIITIDGSLSSVPLTPPVKISAYEQTYKGAVTINTGTEFHTVNSVNFGAAVNAGSNSIGFWGQSVTTQAVNAGTMTSHASSTLTLNGNIILTGDLNTNGSVTGEGNIDVTGPWQHSGTGNITAKGNIKAGTFTQTAAGSILLFNGSGIQTLEVVSASQIQNLENNGNLKLNSDITIIGTFENNGTFDAQTRTVKLDPPANGTVTITGTGTAGDTAFNNLSLTNAGGKTLTINGKITVDNLNISGTSAASKLTVQGGTDSEITLTSDQTPDPGTKKGYYLNVNTNIRIADGKTYYVADSILGSPNPANWEHMYSTWKTNATNDNWNTASNWTPGVVPTADWPVIIPAGGVGTKYPKLTAPSLTNPAPQAQSVTVHGELDLDSYTISDGSNTAPLINNSVLKMTGTAAQKAWFENSSSNDKITLGDNSTIEYYDSTNNDVWAGPYKNLSLNNRPDLKTNNENLTVNGVLTITGSGTHIDTGTGTQTYNGIITATGKDIILEGSTITTKHNITANNIKVLGDWNSNSGTITANINIEAAKWNSTGNVTATTGKIKVTGDWNSNSGNITAGTNIEAAKWNSKQGSITAGADIIVTGDWYSERSIISGINITSSGSKWTSWGGITATGNIDIENELAFTGGRITVGGNLAAKKLNAYSDAYSGGLIFFNGSGTRKLSGAGGNNIIDGKIQNLEIKSGVTLKLESDITITVGLNNQGEFDAVTKSKKVRLVHAAGLLTPPVPPNNITIKGNTSAVNTKFHNLECTNAGGKALTINGKITVAGNFDISGTAWNDLLNIKGPGEITLGSNQTPGSGTPPQKGYYLNIHTNIPITGTYTYRVKESKPDGTEQEIYTDKKPKNWIFDDCLIEMKWLGGSGTTDPEKTAWSAPKNWLPNGIPGIHTPVKIESGKTYYPKLTANVKAKTITLNGELDLDSYTISDDAGGTSRSHIDNKGKLKMTGTEGSPTDQKTWLEIPTSNIGDCITHNDSSIVEYYGSTNNNVWKGPYKNLSLNNRPDLKTNNEDLTVSEKLTIRGSNTHINTGNTSTGGTQTYNGTIDAGNGTSSSPYMNIEFTAKSLETKPASGNNPLNITAGTIQVNAEAWESNANIGAASITVSGNWTSQKGDINLRGGLSAGSFVQNNGILTLGGNGSILKYTAPSGKIKIESLKISSSATVSLGSDIIITKKFQNDGTFKTTTQTVTLEHLGGQIDIIGNNSAASTVGATNNTDFYNLVCTGAGGKTIKFANKISVHGNLTLRGSSGSLLKISGTDNITSSIPELNHSGTIYINSNKNPSNDSDKCKWLDVNVNLPIKSVDSNTYTCKTYESRITGTIQLIEAGNPLNWIFNDYIGEMKWSAKEANDTDKTKWDKSKNWIPNGIPGTHTKVNIPTGINKYPKLESSTNAKAEKITLNGELDLAGYVITDTLNTAPLTNNGLLKMTGTADQKTWFENSSSNDKITLGDNSTVQYDSGSSANVFSGPYANLILNRSIAAAFSLTVNKKTTVNAAATITAPAQTYGGDVRINANTTFSAINSITFSHAIGASANNVTFDGTGIINTQAVTAGNITLNLNTGAWTSSGVINSSGDITVNNGSGAWTSSGSVTADNINTQRDWISSDDVTAAGNITSNNAWTASSGNIALKGNLSANQFTQTGGTLIFNGNGTPQTLLFTNPAGQKNIYNLIIDTGAKLELCSDITIKRDFTNKGTFNADTHTVTLTNDADHKIIGTDTAGDTKFYNLFCEDAGDKTLTFENEIWVEKKMYLSGSYSTGIKPLNIDGNGVVSLNNNHPIPGNVSITNIRQKFLRVFSNKVKIGNNKYYGTDESTDDQGTTKNNNGWVFYKTFELVNSFAIPGKNEIYLLFKNGSANNVYTELTEADLANPNFTPLIITDGSSHVYAENRLYIPERLPLPSAIKEHTFWKFTLNNSISPDWILNQNALISLDYYDRKKQKLHISDIGIDMITPQRASNSIVLRSFDASEDDKALPRLDVTILAEKKGASNNAQLYFYSKDSAEHKLWHPGTVPIGPPPRFAVPQAGTTNYGCTLENNLLKSIISEQDVHLEPNKVGGFMYIYDGWLPCARLRNSNDILSFDVWHFKIVGVQKQKGGVSIFDNVLDPYKGQETIIAAHLQKPGMLTIQIMSLDGSIIRTIERSYKAAGDHIYFWDGKNNGGNPVARGIYFVRIAGPDIDEVRKILVVKN
ncbi:FlgD immunoglobulin-like domain containing protein [Treponema denticola]|uniref:FlgD immunoglobulin-like domain containing protein n=1 Tax=Treponema denticola TaxID=158 RepID=UPI002105B0B1|nr:FlgD immunoglobulin-like domain containing protein [Treponema denticola]UTY22901.1 hypothetical protein E4N78_01020 [Treponema denticola]